MTAVSLTDRPRALAELEFTPPSGAGQKWTVYEPTSGRILRLGYGAVCLLQRLDGDHNIGQLVGNPSTGANPESVSTLVGSFRELGLLTESETDLPESGRTRRIMVDGPFHIRFVLSERPRWLAPGSSLARLASLKGVRTAGVGLALFGLVALQANRAEMATTATSRPSWLEAVIVLVLVLSINWLHELAHGATLAAGGHTPRRLGLMLLYLYPAMFCDVTDAWRLHSKRDRVSVLLAGPLFQGAWAGLLAGSALVADGSTRTVLLLASAITYLMAVGNLIPFLKLDGYFALSAYLDLPNLQRKAIGDLRRVVERVLTGRCSSRRELAPGWALFGLASVLFPILIVGRLTIAIQPLLVSAGRTGSAIWLVGVLGALAVMVRGLGRAWALVPRSRHLGAIASALVILTGSGLASNLIHRNEVTVGAIVDISNETELLIPDSHLLSVPEIGDEVEMIRSGLLGQTTVGRATVIGPPSPQQASIGLLLPVRGIESRIPMTSVEVMVISGDPGQASHGVVIVGSQSLTRSIGDFIAGDAIDSWVAK